MEKLCPSAKREFGCPACREGHSSPDKPLLRHCTAFRELLPESINRKSSLQTGLCHKAQWRGRTLQWACLLPPKNVCWVRGSRWMLRVNPWDKRCHPDCISHSSPFLYGWKSVPDVVCSCQWCTFITVLGTNGIVYQEWMDGGLVVEERAWFPPPCCLSPSALQCSIWKRRLFNSP